MSLEAPVEVMRVLEHAFRPVEQRPLMLDLEDGMDGGLRKVCAFLVEVAQATGVIGPGARVRSCFPLVPPLLLPNHIGKRRKSIR